MVYKYFHAANRDERNFTIRNNDSNIWKKIKEIEETDKNLKMNEIEGNRKVIKEKKQTKKRNLKK